jgi:hypothetical protein
MEATPYRGGSPGLHPAEVDLISAFQPAVFNGIGDHGWCCLEQVTVGGFLHIDHRAQRQAGEQDHTPASQLGDLAGGGVKGVVPIAIDVDQVTHGVVFADHRDTILISYVIDDGAIFHRRRSRNVHRPGEVLAVIPGRAYAQVGVLGPCRVRLGNFVANCLLRAR